jgi:hypothetical protein
MWKPARSPCFSPRPAYALAKLCPSTRRPLSLIRRGAVFSGALYEQGGKNHETQDRAQAA